MHFPIIQNFGHHVSWSHCTTLLIFFRQIVKTHLLWILQVANSGSNKHILNGKMLTKAQCTYLDIYISWKIRLCVVDKENKFQTNLQAKLINFLVWKLKIIILIFLLFFAQFVKSSAVCTMLLLFQRVNIFQLLFLHQIAFQIFQVKVCKTHLIW